MNTTELIQEISRQTGVGKEVCKHMISVMVDAIRACVEAGDPVTIARLGTWEIVTEKERRYDRRTNRYVLKRTKRRVMFSAGWKPQRIED